MKPNEHIKLPDDELIAHIKEQLMAHEEDYAPGAWENFNAEKPAKKKGMFFVLGSISSAAALILIGFAIFFANKKAGINPAELTKVKQVQENTKQPALTNERPDTQGNTVPPTDRQESQPITASSKKIVNRNFNVNTAEVTAPVIIASRKEELGLVTKPINTGIKEQLAIATIETVQEKIPASTPVVVAKQSLAEFLAEESRNGNANGVKNLQQQKAQYLPESKWEMGLMVAPSVGSSKKLNMGYGVSMAYALSKNVSINSGISYNEMGASKVINPGSNSSVQDAPSTFSSFPTNSKRLKSVDANLRGIDIPLEIRYRLSKSLYANIGVSAFAVLDQQQKNTFLESQVQNSPLDPATSMLKADVYSTTITEEKGTENLKSDPYLGFYNFSLGYKQQISRGKSVSLEPFVKLPIKEFTQENLYLIGTGLRLKFDF